MRYVPLETLLVVSRSGYWGQDPGAAGQVVRVIRNGDLKPGKGLVGTYAARSFTKAEVEKSRLSAGDLVLTTSGDCGVSGYIGAEPEEVTCASNFIRILRPDPSQVHPRYLFHFTQSQIFRSALAPYIRGTTLKNLSTKAALASIRVPLPPLEKQRAIADVLDHVARLQSSLQMALSCLMSLEEALFHDLFDDVEDFATVAELAVPEKSAIRTGPFGSQLLHSEFVESGVAVLGLDNVVTNEFQWPDRRFITESKYQSLTRYTVFPGDLLISIMGTTGRCVVVPEGIGTVINTKHLCAITPDRSKILPEVLRASFLWHPVSRAHLLRQTKGSIMDGLNMGIIKDTPMPVPSLEAQFKFLEQTSLLGTQIDTMRSAAARLSELSSVLQAQAFRGDL